MFFHSISIENSNNIYFDQTILANTTTEISQPIHLNCAPFHQNQFSQQQSPSLVTSTSVNQSAESLNFLSDQLDLGLCDIFKTFDGSQENSSMNNFTSFNNMTSNKNMTSSGAVSEMLKQQMQAHTNSKASVNSNTNYSDIKLKVLILNFKFFLKFKS